MSFIGGKNILELDVREDCVSSCSYEGSSADESEDTSDIVRRGREICALIPGDRFVITRGYLLTKLIEGNKEQNPMSYAAKIKRYFAAKNKFLQSGPDRG